MYCNSEKSCFVCACIHLSSCVQCILNGTTVHHVCSVFVYICTQSTYFVHVRSTWVCFNTTACMYVCLLLQGLCMSFMSQVARDHHTAVTALCQKHLKLANDILKAPLLQPSDARRTQVEGYWLPIGGQTQNMSERYILTPSVRDNLRNLARIISARSLVEQMHPASYTQCVVPSAHPAPFLCTLPSPHPLSCSPHPPCSSLTLLAAHPTCSHIRDLPFTHPPLAAIFLCCCKVPPLLARPAWCGGWQRPLDTAVCESTTMNTQTYKSTLACTLQTTQGSWSSRKVRA